MTDNEIIKALERCTMRGKGELDRVVCVKCPYYNIICCEEHLMVDALGLINRQKAELETVRKREGRWHALLGFSE